MTDLFLLVDEVRIQKIRVFSGTQMEEELKEIIKDRGAALIGLRLRAFCTYTEREERKASAGGSGYACPAKTLEELSKVSPVPEEQQYAKGNYERTLWELHEGYTALEAERDGCVVVSGHDLLHGELIWEEFLQKTTEENKPAVIRIYQEYPLGLRNSVYYLKELNYDGNRYRLSFYDQTGDTKEWFLSQESYAYLLDQTHTEYQMSKRAFCLTDSPESTYGGYLRQLVSSTPQTDASIYSHFTTAFVMGISQKPGSATHIYHLVIRDGDLELVENGEVLPGEDYLS